MSTITSTLEVNGISDKPPKREMSQLTEKKFRCVVTAVQVTVLSVSRAAFAHPYKNPPILASCRFDCQVAEKPDIVQTKLGAAGRDC
jgi:hypothetical protein